MKEMFVGRAEDKIVICKWSVIASALVISDY